MAAGSSEDVGKLLLRIAVGFFVLVHSYFNLRHGVEWIKGPLREIGLPAVLAYGAYLGGIVAPLMVLIGYRTRIAAPVIAVTMVAAIAVVLKMQVGRLTDVVGGGGLELETFLLLGALALSFVGGGRFGVRGGRD